LNINGLIVGFKLSKEQLKELKEYMIKLDLKITQEI
jgi:hypothetical protein